MFAPPCPRGLTVPAAVLGLGRATPPSERITLGFIGVGSRGSGHVQAFGARNGYLGALHTVKVGVPGRRALPGAPTTPPRLAQRKIHVSGSAMFPRSGLADTSITWKTFWSASGLSGIPPQPSRPAMRRRR
jgi:hypothetical protein